MNNKFATLFSLFRKLDYRDKDNSAKKKLTGVILAYLIANTALSYNYYVSFDERSFIILGFTSGLFLIAMIVLTDFDNLFLASRTSALLRILPLESNVVFNAKFMSAVLFLLLFILASSIPQVIFFYFLTLDLLKTFSFLISEIMFCYFSTGILLLIYSVSLKYFRKKATLILNVLQIIFFVFIFYSSTLSSKARSLSKDLFVRMNILDYPMVKYLPQTLFSDGVYSVTYFVICFLLTVAVFVILYFMISKNYYSLLDRVSELNTRKKSTKRLFNFGLLNSFIEKNILNNNYERGSFNLVKHQLKNSRFLRVKYIPLMIMPLIIVTIGIASDAPQFLFFNKYAAANSFFHTSLILLSPSIAFTLIMSSRLLVSNTKILDENSSGTLWIYESLPTKEMRFINKGAIKFVYLYCILPVVIIISILLLTKTDLLTVSSNILFILSGMYFINSISLLFDKNYPFTLESTKFNSASKFIEIFFSVFLCIVLFLIQIFVFQNIIFVAIAVIIFITASMLLNRN